MSPHTRSLASQMAPCHILPGGRRFGVKYVGKQHADHLCDSICKNYSITEDWAGELYCGITLKWDYVNRSVNLSMPGYIAAPLHKFQHPTSNPASSSTCSTQMDQTNLWSHPTAHTTCRHLRRPTTSRSHTNYANHRNSTLLRSSS